MRRLGYTVSSSGPMIGHRDECETHLGLGAWALRREERIDAGGDPVRRYRGIRFGRVTVGWWVDLGPRLRVRMYTRLMEGPGVVRTGLLAREERMARPAKDEERCKYCDGNGWFYSDEDLGPCGCLTGQLRAKLAALTTLPADAEGLEPEQRVELGRPTGDRDAAAALYEATQDHMREMIDVVIPQIIDDAERDAQVASRLRRGLPAEAAPVLPADAEGLCK